jgi:hypothetical protein
VDSGGTPPGRGRPNAPAQRTAQEPSLTGTGLMARPVPRREQGGDAAVEGHGPESARWESPACGRPEGQSSVQQLTKHFAIPQAGACLPTVEALNSANTT